VDLVELFPNFLFLLLN